MTIRPASVEDWPLIWPIWHETVAAGDTYEYPPETGADEARRLWLPPEPARPVPTQTVPAQTVPAQTVQTRTVLTETWLAEAGGAVVGTYNLRPNRRGLGDHVANAGYMVASAARGRGIGRAMAEHSLRRARELGYLAMQFNAVVASNYGAIALWRSLGFLIVGTVPDAFRHRERGLTDILVMHRYL